MVFLAADDQHGPAVGVLLVGLGLGAGVEVGEGSLEDRYAGARHVILLIQLPGFVLADGVAEAVAELLEGQRHCPVPVGGVGEDRGRGLDRGGRQRQDTARGCRVDSYGGGGQAAAGQDLGEQAAEGMADDGGLGVELPDDFLLVGGDVADGLAGEHAGVLAGQLDGGRVVRPARGDCAVAGVLEERAPVVPAAVKQPQAVHEDDGLPA